jgi:hypothetical protein
LPLFLPTEAHLVTFDLAGHDELHRLQRDLERWNLHVFDDGREEALAIAAPMDALRKRPGYVRDEKAWVFTGTGVYEAGGWLLKPRAQAGLRAVENSMGLSVVAGSREDCLAVLADCYLPVALLWHVWTHEEGDLKRLARAALDGDDKALPILADALTDAGHPLAGAARALCTDAEGVVAFPLKEYPRNLGLLSDGSALLEHHEDGSVLLRSVPEGKVVRGSRQAPPQLKPDRGHVPAFFSWCGRFVMLNGGPSLACWRVCPWGLLWEKALPAEEAMGAMSFSPDGSLLGGYCGDRTMRVLDTLTGDEVGRLRFPKDARRLNLTDVGWAFLHQDRRCGLWDPRGRPKVVWRDLPGGLHSLGTDTLVSPDGTRLVARSAEGQIGILHFIDVPGCRVIATRGVTGFHTPLGWTPDGSRLFTNYHPTILAWDGNTGERVAGAEARRAQDR